MAALTVDCMACLVAASRMRAADGPAIILEGVTHATYPDWQSQERLTCRFYKKIGFRALLYDAVTRAMRGLRPRPVTSMSLAWTRFKTSLRKHAKSTVLFTSERYGP